MTKPNEKLVEFPRQSARDILTDVLRDGAQQMLATAIEAEVDDYLAGRASTVDAAGRRYVVRNGHLPPRAIQTPLGDVQVQQPRVRDRRPTDERETFRSAILPPYLRKTPSWEALYPWRLRPTPTTVEPLRVSPPEAVDIVVIVCGSEEIARHRRSYGREELIFDPLHYLALLERKTDALDSSGTADRVGAARRVAPAAAALGDPAGQSRDPRVCAGLAAPRGLSAGPRPRRYPGRPATGRDQVRRRQASRSVPPRPPAAPPRPGTVSASPGPAGDDAHGGRLLDAAGGRGRVMAKSTLLLDAHLKALRLPTFLREYDKVARHCAQEGLDCPRYLCRLCELELLDREQRAIERRIKAAKFPVVKSRETFAFRAIPSLNKRLVLELTRAEYLDRRENVVALGNSGTGKTHLALALGVAACQKGYRVRFTTAAALVNELREARDDKRLLRFQTQWAKQDLLIVDERGYVPLSKTGAELLFEIFSQRYEQASTLVTSHLPFNEWTEILGSERLTGALLDRLTHHVHILELNGDSDRLAHSKHARKDAAAPAS